MRQETAQQSLYAMRVRACAHLLASELHGKFQHQHLDVRIFISTIVIKPPCKVVSPTAWARVDRHWFTIDLLSCIMSTCCPASKQFSVFVLQFRYAVLFVVWFFGIIPLVYLVEEAIQNGLWAGLKVMGTLFAQAFPLFQMLVLKIWDSFGVAATRQMAGKYIATGRGFGLNHVTFVQQ
jgi:hypothetical protein